MLIYTIGDASHGMGHVIRCLTLADELKRRGIGVTFVTTSQTPGLYRLLASGHHVHEFGTYDMTWLHHFQEERVCLIDIENGPTWEMLEVLRPRFDMLIVVNGSGYTLRDKQAVQELSDFRVYQSIFRESDLHGVYGVEHIVIDPRYAQCQSDYNGPIVVSMGGADPYGLTPLVVNALRTIKRDAIVVTGPAAVDDSFEAMHTVRAPSSLEPYFNGASLYVGALGMTAYEAAAAGVPSLLTAWSKDHERTALELEKRGVAVSMGMWDVLTESLVRDMAEIMLMDSDSWQAMSAAGKALVDGRGVERVAGRIQQALQLVEAW